MLRGATIQWLADPGGIDLDAARQEITAILSRYYAAPRPDNPREDET